MLKAVRAADEDRILVRPQSPPRAKDETFCARYVDHVVMTALAEPLCNRLRRQQRPDRLADLAVRRAVAYLFAEQNVALMAERVILLAQLIKHFRRTEARFVRVVSDKKD